MSRIITLIAAAHLGHFHNLDEIATAKAEIFEGIEPGGTALLNRDDPRWKLLDRLARAAGVEHVLGFGEHARAELQAGRMRACRRRLGDRRQDRRHARSRRGSARPAATSSRMRWPCSAPPSWSAPISTRWPRRLPTLTPESGRGRRHELALPGGTLTPDRRELQRQSGLDEGGAGAARRQRPCRRAGGASPCSATCWSSATTPPSCMPGWPNLIKGKHIDLVLLAGPEMKALAEKLAERTESRVPGQRR